MKMQGVISPDTENPIEWSSEGNIIREARSLSVRNSNAVPKQG